MSMPGYTKLFNSILASTIWLEDNETRIVWIAMLAMADKNGLVEASMPGLAAIARVPQEACKSALAKLESPDSYSRSKDHGGRRIAQVEGGWQILNHAKYRAKMSADERREYNRIKQREFRERQSNNVIDNEEKSALSAHTEADTEAKADTKEETRTPTRAIGSPEFDRFWQAYPYKIDRTGAVIEWCKKLLDAKTDVIISGLTLWKSSERWQDQRFIPEPSRFLNKRQWETVPPQKGETKNEQGRRKTREAIERVLNG